MKILARVGARATVLTAVVALTLAAPAAADATAYLMYLKGSEGPPAVPMRVVWDARDDANGHVTIDLGANYEPALTKLGLPRVLEYDAQREKSQFAVHEGEFARFAKVVGAHERAHVKGLEAALGKKAIKKPKFDFQGIPRHPQKFVKSDKVLEAALAIHAVEARHASWARLLAGAKGAPKAFDAPLSMKEVLRAVGKTGFIKG